MEMDVEAAPTEPGVKRVGVANQPPIVLFLRENSGLKTHCNYYYYK
jgi:hypothetical protein